MQLKPKKTREKDVINKLNDVLSKKTGCQQLKNISEVLQDKANLNTSNEHFTIAEIVNLKFVSLTSCVVERVFELYKQ